jgi:hypothetical protein
LDNAWHTFSGGSDDGAISSRHWCRDYVATRGAAQQPAKMKRIAFVHPATKVSELA